MSTTRRVCLNITRSSDLAPAVTYYGPGAIGTTDPIVAISFDGVDSLHLDPVTALELAEAIRAALPRCTQVDPFDGRCKAPATEGRFCARHASVRAVEHAVMGGLSVPRGGVMPLAC